MKQTSGSIGTISVDPLRKLRGTKLLQSEVSLPGCPNSKAMQVSDLNGSIYVALSNVSRWKDTLNDLSGC